MSKMEQNVIYHDKNHIISTEIKSAIPYFDFRVAREPPAVLPGYSSMASNEWFFIYTSKDVELTALASASHMNGGMIHSYNLLRGKTAITVSFKEQYDATTASTLLGITPYILIYRPYPYFSTSISVTEEIHLLGLGRNPEEVLLERSESLTPGPNSSLDTPSSQMIAFPQRPDETQDLT